MQVSAFKHPTTTTVVLRSSFLYVVLIVVFAVASELVDPGSSREIGYITPFLLFTSIGYGSIIFFRHNNRDYTSAEIKHLLIKFVSLDVFLHAIGFAASLWILGWNLEVTALFALILMIALDTIAIYVTLRHFWKIYTLV